MASLDKTLNIPVAVIADLDTIMDDSRLRQVVLPLSGDGAVASNFLSAAAALRQEISSIAPRVGPSDVGQKLHELSDLPADSHKGDVRVVQQLRALAKEIDRTRSIKQGVAAFDSPIQTRLKALILEAAKFGLFLVPVGELEGRLAGRGLTTSKDRKAERATEAAALIGRLGYQPDDVWEFISNVERFLFPTNPEEELNAVPRTEA